MDYVLEFDIPDKIILEHIVGRRILTLLSRVYHVKFNPPQIINRDDITGKELSIHKDD
ncbi:MAG: hypothetical protein ACTS8H_02115 [Arsenophonus sp. NC-PE1-MAG3]